MFSHWCSRFCLHRCTAAPRARRLVPLLWEEREWGRRVQKRDTIFSFLLCSSCSTSFPLCSLGFVLRSSSCSRSCSSMQTPHFPPYRPLLSWSLSLSLSFSPPDSSPCRAGLRVRCLGHDLDPGGGGGDQAPSLSLSLWWRWSALYRCRVAT